ncbi:unnamed protein product [Closterium sp. Naga37s-1]|nr:unnamed protein product [Closterium sp. Naga37s-1]
MTKFYHSLRRRVTDNSLRVFLFSLYFRLPKPQRGPFARQDHCLKGGRAVHGWWAGGHFNAEVWCGATLGTGSMQPQAEGPKYAHPQVVFFTCFFKAAALGFYLLGSWFTSSFVIDFVVCVLLIALDFWVVKNVSGRILVGLRWWNETDEAGETLWHFESLDQASLDQLSKTDAWVFWWTLYCTPALWLGLGLIQVIRLSFDYLLIIIVALVLGAANIYGYTKCRRDAKKQIQQFAAQTMAQNFASTLTSALAAFNYWSYLPGAAPALLREMQAEMFSTAAALGLVSNGERGNSGNLDLSRNAQSQFNTAVPSFGIPGLSLLGRRLLEHHDDAGRKFESMRIAAALQVVTRVFDSSSATSRKQVGPNAGMGAYAQSGNIGSINNQNTVNDQTADATKTGPGTPGVIATPYSQYQRRGATAYQTNTQSQTATTNAITPTYQFGSTSATNTITALGGGGAGYGGYGGLGAVAASTGGALGTLSSAGVPFATSLMSTNPTGDPIGQGVKCVSQFDGGGCSEEGFLPAAHASARPVEVISELGPART